MVAAGKFPKPFPIFSGGRAVGWREHEIEAWLQQRSNAAGGGHE
jgi:predicted DNA-binding transcriptional regulator AlpA